MLFNEPKLLKCICATKPCNAETCFSALQRAEIAEIVLRYPSHGLGRGFSALQRAEIAEIQAVQSALRRCCCFSALQRAEIAEILECSASSELNREVSVLFNEPKLLKSSRRCRG